MTNTEVIDCTTCKYGYEDERLGIPMCHHPKRFSEDCVDSDFRMYEEKETKESEKPIDGLEEEIQKYMSERWKFGCINPTTPVYLYDFTTDELKECARHFAQWGAEHLKK